MPFDTAQCQPRTRLVQLAWISVHIGNAAFSGTAGELRSAAREDYSFIEGDMNGNGKADGSIVLTGAHQLAATDFVL